MKTALEIANTVIEQAAMHKTYLFEPHTLIILAGAVVKLTDYNNELASARSDREIQQSQALKEAEEIISKAIMLKCHDDEGFLKLNTWLAKYGEKK